LSKPRSPAEAAENNFEVVHTEDASVFTPMRKQGAIILGIGGHRCRPDGGANPQHRHEGAMGTGYPIDATENAAPTNIIAAGYR
jgi:hypothetical protein